MRRPRLSLAAVPILVALSAALGGCAALVEPSSSPAPPEVQVSGTPEPSSSPLPTPSPPRPPVSPPVGNPAPD